MTETAQTATEKILIYDADETQRFPFQVTESGEKFDTVHIFSPFSDETYLEYINNVNIHGNDKEVKENIREATVKFWKEQCVEIENIEIDEGKDFRDFVDVDGEILPSMNAYLAVAIVEPEKISNGKRKLAAKTEQTVITEAYFNGEPIQQTHALKAKTDEFSKKFSRIEKNEWKQETTKGLRRKADIYYVPQHKAKGELYDEMIISQTGFVSWVPLRFKVTVIDYVFASNLEPKK